MPNNDDLINDILNELDSKKSSSPEDDLEELLSASSEPEIEYSQELPSEEITGYFRFRRYFPE